MLADKLNLVKKNIEEACDTAGRSPKEVTLIASVRPNRWKC